MINNQDGFFDNLPPSKVKKQKTKGIRKLVSNEEYARIKTLKIND